MLSLGSKSRSELPPFMDAQLPTPLLCSVPPLETISPCLCSVPPYRLSRRASRQEASHPACPPCPALLCPVLPCSAPAQYLLFLHDPHLE